MGPVSDSGGCGEGASVSGQFGLVRFFDEDGDQVGAFIPFNGGVAIGGDLAGTVTAIPDFRVYVVGDEDWLPPPSSPPQFAPGTEPPQVGDPAPATAPAVAPVPLPLLPAAPPATAPGGQPLPGPATAPGGLPTTTPARPLLPGLRPGRGTGISTVSPGSGTNPITAGGTRPQLPPAQQPTSTGTTFLPGGRPLAPNGPPPTMAGIATELGKLEQKLEIMLNPKDSLSPLELLNKVIDQIENVEFLIERLFPQGPYTFPAGQYELAPVCDRDSEGALLPPRVAPWAAGEGEITEIRRKLDALAALVQHHKDLKQPTCGGRGSGPGSNVTVHFESD